MQTYQKAWCAVLFILAGICFPTQAQTPTFKTPADYNDYIVVEQAIIGQKLEAFNQSLAGSDFKLAKKQHAELITQISRSMQKVYNLPDYKGNTDFKQAAYELFTFYKMIIETDYVKIMDIAEKEGINDNTFAKISSIFTGIQRDEAVMFGLFNRAQNNFSKQFGMKITENQFEKERKEKTDSLGKKP